MTSVIKLTNNIF